MCLKLMYITNDPAVALIAERNGVGRIWIDLETLGKEERQKNMNTVKSHHTIQDIYKIAEVLTRAELMVRINPWNENSEDEIEKVISAGANRIMLPMWKTEKEVENFLHTVNQRVDTTLLLETKEALECLDTVLKMSMLDEIHIGLNDLHLSLGLNFMFELLSDGTVERICKKLRKADIPFGFGGIARLGEGILSAEKIVMEHYRLGSTRVILSRSFCNAEEITNLAAIDEIFKDNIKKLREFEKTMEKTTVEMYRKNQESIAVCVKQIVDGIKEKNK